MSEIKALIDLDWRFRKYKASSFVNGLIYFLGRLPLIGKMIPTTMLYREYGLKKGVAIIKLIFSLLLSFVLQTIPFALSYLLAKGVNSFLETEVSLFFVWFIAFNVIWTCIGKIFPSLTKQEVQFIVNFRVSKEQYIKRTSLLKILNDLIFMLPSLLVVGFLEKNIILYLLIGIFSSLSMSLIWLVVDLHMTLMKHRLILKLTLITLWTVGVLGLSYVLIVNQEFYLLEKIIINWMSAFIWLVLWFPFLYLYVHFKRYEAYSQQMFKSSEVMINYGGANKKEQQQKQYLGEGTKMKLEKEEDDQKLDKLKGSKYLNALLFSRFRSSLRKSLLIRVGIVSAVMLTIVVASVIVPIGISADRLERILYNFIPGMFFILFLLSFGKKVVQTVFVNCDSSMLTYPFYREPKAIIQGFFYRFLKIFYYNGIISLTIYLWINIFNLVNKKPLSLEFLLLVLFVMLSLSILFSFHELFVYYILQPFTSDFEVKNPVYKFVDWLFYMLAYISLQIKSVGFEYGIIISIFSILYFIVGVVVIIKVAPKTFKLKN